ncbi:succinate dehydrogenase, cytochrome b556 subunit [Sphingomonas flavalba]|uniref:succinate dehydrogenase, cytochrome b556 subunit n=1 Tax=Sphingomonas flavalba TaxID=2559804 RepID=UPI00109D93E9|nr:succinate dehydrogenase, cytochrome b556 subunit [Sphingomonas flavalba]
MAHRNPARPLSPHLTIWKWGPHMLVSILHRATGIALAVGGALLLTCWLAAVAGGPEAYQRLLGCLATPWVGIAATVVGVGLTWSLFQHLCSGIRHLILDTGVGYELKANRAWSIATLFISVAATAAVWLYVFRGML